MKLKLFIMMWLLALCSSLPVYSEASSSETIPVEKEPDNGDVPNKRRIPGQKILCIIDSVDGVTIPGVSEGDILSYEAYDADEVCIAAFADEASFVEFFFSDLNGTIASVRFVTSDYAYRGFVN